MTVVLGLATVSLGIWLLLLFGRGGFWREAPHPAPVSPGLEHWPRVSIVIPARNEAKVVDQALASLLAQDYPGAYSIILVDDASSDGTAEAAAKAALDAGSEERLNVVSGEALPQGWTGKLWAASQGIADAARRFPESEYILLTDADIAHAPDNLRQLVERAETGACDLVSLMVEMPHESFAEKAFLPAFVFFFAMLYPFSWVRDRKRSTAAAAGGVMLVRAKALQAIGGIAAIRDALIDDCALGKALKKNGPIWLGLAPEATRSLRRYPWMGEIWAMIVRSAYTELRHSPIRLLAAIIGMGLTFLAPPLVIFAGGATSLLGLLASGLMVFAYLPTLRRCRLSYFWALALPLVALFYLLATVESARRYHAGQGGQWKGRTTLKGTA